MGEENSIGHSKNSKDCIGSKNKLNKVEDRNTGTRHARQDETGREGELGGAAFEAKPGLSVICIAEEVGQG